MPTVDLFEEADRRPDLSLGGCCIGPDDWSTECVSCGDAFEPCAVEPSLRALPNDRLVRCHRESAP